MLFAWWVASLPVRWSPPCRSSRGAATTSVPTVAVIPFSSEGLTVWWEAGFDPGGAFSDLFTDALVNGNKVSVVDRSHIDSVMQEKNLNLSGDISPATSMQLGRLVGAKYLIVGRIVQFSETSANSGSLGGFAPGGFSVGGVKGEKVTLRVSSRIIEASTGRIVATLPEERSKVGTSFSVGAYSNGVAGGYSSQQFLSSSMGVLINEAAQEMAGKLDIEKLASAPAGPSVSAHILTVEGADVVINKGSADGVSEGMFFDVFQIEERHGSGFASDDHRQDQEGHHPGGLDRHPSEPGEDRLGFCGERRGRPVGVAGFCMRAVWLTKKGGPGAFEVRETPEPQPVAGQVRIRVRAAGVNFADVMASQGIYPGAPPTPCVLGYEAAGVVDALGAGVDPGLAANACSR